MFYVEIKELELTLEEIIEDKKNVINNYTEEKNKEMMRMTEEFSQDANHVVQTEILVLRKQLINKEMELNEIANQRIVQKKNLEKHVYQKYKEKVTITVIVTICFLFSHVVCFKRRGGLFCQKKKISSDRIVSV